MGIRELSQVEQKKLQGNNIKFLCRGGARGSLIDGGGDQRTIARRVNELRGEIDATDSDYDREKLEELVAKLAGGVAVVKVGATEEPLRQIVHNGGGDAPVVPNRVKEGTGTFSCNAATEAYGDMVKMGVIDPTKVTRLALQNAASVAALPLTTEAAIVSLPTEDGGPSTCRTV